MELTELANELVPRLKLPLPGALAHEPIRAISAGGIAPRFEHKLPPKPGSVLILLYPDQGSIKLPLTKRQTYAGAHSDQVSLPGGKTEPGETSIDTALREAEEEIGIDRSQVNVIGTLSNFFVIPSNFMIVPVIAYSTVKPVFKPDPFEVARILTG
ncbi:MAG TPA: CoA pyrophosphatase, partial [Cyclobacteriaceae bacterium]